MPRTILHYRWGYIVISVSLIGKDDQLWVLFNVQMGYLVSYIVIALSCIYIEYSVYVIA